MVFMGFSRRSVGGLNLKMRFLYFYYDLIVMGNQVPLFFNFFFFGLIGLICYRWIHLYASVPFFLMSIYNLVLGVHDYIANVLLKGNEKIPSPNDDMSHIEIMLYRTSIRSYQRRYLRSEDEEFVREALKNVDRMEGINFHYIKKDFQTILVTDAYQYVVCVIPKKYNNDTLISIGMSLQDVILRMVRRGISTCWVGGFRGDEVVHSIKGFNPKEDHIAVCMAFGYESQYKPLEVRRQNKRSRTRFPETKTYFDKTWGVPLPMKKLSSEWKTIFNVTKWSPSGANMQQTKIIRDEDQNKYHFYKQGGSVYYSIMGIGISMRNWKNACELFGVNGRFEKENPGIKVPKDVLYVISWICD